MAEFIKTLETLVSQLGALAWGPPMLILLVGTGIYLTFLLKGLQFTTLFYSLKLIFVKKKDAHEHEGDISNFQALMTALSATVGTGNIAGVATAIAAGGPGALFWMWMTGLVGMATKYSEAVLAVKYREKDKHGNMRGGPMYYISKGLGMKWLGVAFAIFASFAAFGIGNMTQSNSVAAAMQATFNVPSWVTGLFLMTVSAFVLIGGIKSIGKVTSFLVPVMIGFYVTCSLLIIFMNFEMVPAAFELIFVQAFTPTAAAGGFLGSTIMLTIRMGVARGVFSNESGLGSSPIAAAAAQTKHPVYQALISMTQTFIDTIIVCTMTGLVIVMSGLWTSGQNGAELTANSFSWGISGGNIVVAIGLILFAYSTILGWCYYGEKAIEYLFGERSIKPYRYVFILFVGVGAISKLEFVWSVSDTFNGLMALPNLIALVLLSPVVAKETKDFLKNHK